MTSDSQTFKCTLWPSGEVLELNGEETLLSQMKKAGKNIKSSCGGCATCGDCVVVIKSGELNLSPQPFEELRLLGNVFHITKERLSCQTRLTGDVTIDISAHEKATHSSKNADASQGPKSTRTVLRKREDIEKTTQELDGKSQEKKTDTWYRHWENDEQNPQKNKKLGGGRRVKPFRFSEPEKDDEQK